MNEVNMSLSLLQSYQIPMVAVRKSDDKQILHSAQIKQILTELINHIFVVKIIVSCPLIYGDR